MSKKRQSPLPEDDDSNKHSNNSTNPSISLNDNQLSRILDYYAEYHPRANQARRFITAMARKPDTPTNKLNRGGGVNLSQVARINNPRLKKFGYLIRCRIPPVPIKNTYGENSAQELWGICETG